MLNFLRKLRHNNMKGKYIKYALGEIVLVVIGILIALSINNWNERRKDRLKAVELTKKLKVELEQTVEYCDFTIKGINRQIKFIQDILNVQETGIDSINLDTPFDLSIVFYMSSYSQFFDPPSDIYQAAINDGSIRLITDEVLTNLLQEFHQSYQNRANELIAEEYTQGREINDYLSRNYADVFKNEMLDADGEWIVETIMELLEQSKYDGTLRYKLVERIETKRARRAFVLRFRQRIQEQINNM